jgi:type IV pilus assembly protein PilV
MKPHMKCQRNLPTRQRQQGVALLEVLIVFFVLSIGLLGMAALQLKSIQYTQSAYQRSQATVAANDMLDRIRLHGGEKFADGDPELVDWVNTVNGTLPTNGVDPSQDCDSGICTINISWEDRFANETDGTTTQTLVVSSRM